MQFKVPIEKDVAFANSLLDVLSSCLTELKTETGKWPDRLIFSGSLGKEIHAFLIDKDWDLSHFNPTYLTSAVNKIRLEYSKPISQIEDRESTIFDGSLSSREISGIPDARTMAKITSVASSSGFKIERSIRPSLEIRLFR